MKVTLWRDPHDCGLRVESGEIRHPRDFHEGNPGSFPRVSWKEEERLGREVGDMMPETPGEFSHVEVE